MRVHIRDIEALKAVSPAALSAYARASGWTKTEEYGDHSDVYAADRMPEIILPRHQSLGDDGRGTHPARSPASGSPERGGLSGRLPTGGEERRPGLPLRRSQPGQGPSDDQHSVSISPTSSRLRLDPGVQRSGRHTTAGTSRGCRTWEGTWSRRWSRARICGGRSRGGWRRRASDDRSPQTAFSGRRSGC